jgi:hypothetical protein
MLVAVTMRPIHHDAGYSSRTVQQQNLLAAWDESMTKFVMVVASSPHAGRDDDYTDWYDNVHIPELCTIPGIMSGKRYAAVPSPNPVPGQYLAIYDVETDDINSVLTEMGRRAVAGEMSQSNALDRESAKMWFYEVP